MYVFPGVLTQTPELVITFLTTTFSSSSTAILQFPGWAKVSHALTLSHYNRIGNFNVYTQADRDLFHLLLDRYDNVIHTLCQSFKAFLNVLKASHDVFFLRNIERHCHALEEDTPLCGRENMKETLSLLSPISWHEQ